MRRYTDLIKGIGNVGELSTEELIKISRGLFSIVSLCNFKADKSFDGIEHHCDYIFDHHDSVHSPTCKYCQKRMLLYYLGRCMEKLADDDRLPEFGKAHLSNARIRDRTYDHIRIGSEMIFSITRHLNAWRDEPNMETIIQTWVFNFRDLSLKELTYDASTVGISIRRLMESRSEWKGTGIELLAKLGKVAKTLKIDTKINWPKSSRKLNQMLQDLEEYLKTYGIVIEKQRYIKLSTAV